MNSSLANTLEAKPQGQASTLAAVLKLTQAMLEAAREGEWVEVSEGELHRRALLEECFSKSVDPELSEIFAEALATMLHMNDGYAPWNSAAVQRLGNRDFLQPRGTTQGLTHA